MAHENPAQAAAMDGAQNAAVLLMSLGEEDAATVLKHMDARDVQRVGTAMASLKSITRDQARQVLDRFTREVEDQASLGMATEDYIRKVLTQALGKQEASELIDRIMMGRSSKGLEALKWMESRSIADMIGQEHPQIIALVLAHLEPDHSAEILGYLPEAARADVVLRIATLEGVQPQALHELDDVMERQFSGKSGKLQSARLGGLKAAAAILNSMDASRETELIASIRKADSALGDRIEELMFTFEDLTGVDDRSLQALLREVQPARLVVALKGTDASLRDKFFSNMSQRAADMLRDDLEVAGPVRLSDVDAAQKEILAAARKLADAGTISLGGNEEMV